MTYLSNGKRTNYYLPTKKKTKNPFVLSNHKKNGNQHSKKALIIIPNVLAAFFSRRILLMAHGSTVCMLCRWTDMPFICKCLSRSSAATLDLYVDEDVRNEIKSKLSTVNGSKTS